MDDRLIEAAGRGDLASIGRLVAAGADPNTRDATGTPAVMIAARAGQATAVDALLAAGADVDAQDAQLDNILLWAAREGDLEFVRLAHAAGADPTIRNRYGGVGIIPASERGHVEVVRFLLAETAVDVNHVNDLGWTALLEAILLSDGGPDHRAIVALLIEHGADVDLADGDGVRPLAHARARGHSEIAGMLEAAGARP